MEVMSMSRQAMEICVPEFLDIVTGRMQLLNEEIKTEHRDDFYQEHKVWVTPWKVNTQQYSSHGLVFMMGLIQHGVKDGDVIKLSEEKKRKYV